jgi:fumarate hydratase class II
MLVTALSPVIGYQNAAHIAEVTTLKQAALRSGRVGEVRFDNTIMPLSINDEGLGGA